LFGLIKGYKTQSGLLFIHGLSGGLTPCVSQKARMAD
jgi:hypothetical protein